MAMNGFSGVRVSLSPFLRHVLRLAYHFRSDYDQQIQQESDVENTGRLQIKFNNVWGRVCSDGWDDADALVACKAMGYQNGEVGQVPENR